MALPIAAAFVTVVLAAVPAVAGGQDPRAATDAVPPPPAGTPLEPTGAADAPGAALPPPDLVDGGAVFVQPTLLGEVSYAPGRGLRVGNTGLTLGGYSSLNVDRPEGDPARVTLEDLSFFVSWTPTPRFQLFSELELEDLFEATSQTGIDNPDSTFTVERLYADVAITDELSLRVGKYLTPVGRWNVIHAQPLVWTTSRPLVTERPFDPHTTGAMLFGSTYPGHGTLTYSAFGQFMNQFEPVPTPSPAQRSGGARLEYADLLGWSVGGTYLASEHWGDWRQLFGIDGFWARDRFELMGEAAVVDGELRQDDQWGLYLQGVVETWGHVFVVARYEHYAQRGADPLDLFVGGFAWRPLPWLVLKTEYDAATRADRESPPGFRASIAVLF